MVMPRLVLFSCVIPIVLLWTSDLYHQFMMIYQFVVVHNAFLKIVILVCPWL